MPGDINMYEIAETSRYNVTYKPKYEISCTIYYQASGKIIGE
jgi:hypothetical protein